MHSESLLILIFLHLEAADYPVYIQPWTLSGIPTLDFTLNNLIGQLRVTSNYY